MTIWLHPGSLQLGDTWVLAQFLMLECLRTGAKTKLSTHLPRHGGGPDAARTLLAQCLALLDGPEDCFEWCDAHASECTAMTHEQVWGAPER